MDYITGKIKPIKRYKHIIIIILWIVFLASCQPKDERTIWSPYLDINWKAVGYYDAMFHTHPGLGDEQYDPHQTIDRYHEEGYQILTLAGHDYDIPDDYIESIYPWTQLSQIYENIKNVENPTEDNKTYAEIANEPYKDRNPITLNMVSVEGCEVSAPHHMVSLFNSLTTGGPTEMATLQNIQKLDGIVYFAHPGRYVNRWGLTEHWYIDLYKRFNVLIGQSVFNRIDNHPEDRQFFDKIAHLLGIERPIWLFGEDDMHVEKTLGWNRNVILLDSFEPGSMHPDIHNGAAPNVKNALINGQFYLWKPFEQYTPRTFNISDVKIDNKQIVIKIDNTEKLNEVRWLTYDPKKSETVVIHNQLSLPFKYIPKFSHFIRAEIQGKNGTIYTQPFYILNL